MSKVKAICSFSHLNSFLFMLPKIGERRRGCCCFFDEDDDTTAILFSFSLSQSESSPSIDGDDLLFLLRSFWWLFNIRHWCLRFDLAKMHCLRDDGDVDDDDIVDGDDDDEVVEEEDSDGDPYNADILESSEHVYHIDVLSLGDNSSNE
eukprot:CAMPEP_0113466940 /NCGR_PEP_ID=MMETSP0014_2-20120614/14547_1 /TAXON_ID=2857 /ORGANISM="Nitzschia sp." /LENGTH=148 /DNA_ID=CAMNT_0000359211 /DNA_START=75 /DNA_END=521 /DNA_ORIENTATION=- /assembly_acc=CAM_ASM_000159